MRILVTGATGFVGQALVPALIARGHTVRAAVREGSGAAFPPQVEIVRHGNLANDIDWMPLVAGCDAIVHLAGIAHAGPGIPDALYDRVNRAATVALADAAARAGDQKFIFMSSIRAQSGPASDHVLTEAETPHPTDAYGASKLAAEDALRGSALRFTILRPVLVYGPGVKGNLAALTRLAASPLPLPFGALTSRRSLVNRTSLIDAVAFSLDNSATDRQTYVVADRTPIALNALVAALRRGFGKKPGLIAIPRNVFAAPLKLIGKTDVLTRLDGEMIADPSRLIAAGWKPTTDTAAALAELAPSMLPR